MDGIIQGFQSIPAELAGCVLTIGNFDGVHLGHQAILRTARALADARGTTVAAMTFEPPPDLALRPQHAPRRILPPGPKAQRLLDAGANAVVLAEAAPDLLAIPPERFIEEIIVGRFVAAGVVEGADFHFGRRRAGDVAMLERVSRQKGFALSVVQPVSIDLGGRPTRISSTLIRQLVGDGRMPEAARCLGRPFELFGEVIPGEGIGRVLNFPTANIEPLQQVSPPDGVYAAWATIDGQTYPAAVSIGNKPTLGPAKRRFVEAFLLNASGSFYGRPMALAMLERIRQQQRFAGLAELTGQIARDVERVREICAEHASNTRNGRLDHE